MTTEHAGATPGQLRTLNLNIVSGSLSAVGALLVAIDATTWWEAVALAAALAAAVFTVSRWSSGRLFLVAVPCLIVTALVWVLGVLVTESATAAYSLAVVCSVVVYHLPRRRRAAALGLIAFAAAPVVAKLLVPGGDLGEELIQYGLVSPAVAVTAVILTSLNQVVFTLTAELAESRQREAELAVARERIRFAGDLHDIQGHTLHVVKLKVALAEKLVRSDSGRVEEELREVRSLVGETITQTKELVYAQRRLNLSAELENAKNLFTAAGIRVIVTREAEVDARAGELLGQVLRETTTNILRHAQAEQVRITLSETGISIANDGAQEAAQPELRGLSALRRRVADDGGELTVEQKDGRFLTSAAFPHLRSDPALPRTEEEDR
ncbi:sensor histidine kinase [Streptomonospora wellingtoniae]|uniref:Histidine kinase n=1 Tax=Streptomonospora wellingtoniae TaxID=3075544 RepID=A0ABU2KN15_9ACTN|nr:histidine kinase [Streptomonospora sp. DSM 45055]MDT0300662.1 histidine kinase [Streptomonospora sp. DSM 45055]